MTSYASNEHSRSSSSSGPPTLPTLIIPSTIPMFYQPPNTPFLPLQAFIHQQQGETPWHIAQTSDISLHSQSKPQQLFPPHLPPHEPQRQLSANGDSGSVSNSTDSLTTPILDATFSSPPTTVVEKKAEQTWPLWNSGGIWSTTPVTVTASTDQPPILSPAKLSIVLAAEASSVGPGSSAGPVRTRRQTQGKAKAAAPMAAQDPPRRGPNRRGLGRGASVSIGSTRGMAPGSIKVPCHHTQPDQESKTAPSPIHVEMTKTASWPFALHNPRPPVPTSISLSSLPVNLGTPPTELPMTSRPLTSIWATVAKPGSSELTAVPPPNPPAPAPLPPAPRQDDIRARAVNALMGFTVDLRNMTGGTKDEWSALVDDAFQPGSRFFLFVTSTSGMSLHNIDSAYLPHFFTSSGLQSTKLEITSLQTSSSRSVPTPGASTISLNPWADWTWVYGDTTIVWNCRLAMDWVVPLEGQPKLARLEIKVDHCETSQKGKKSGEGMPEQSRRVLQLAEQMENMVGIMAIAQAQNISPHDILKRMTKLETSNA